MLTYFLGIIFQSILNIFLYSPSIVVAIYLYMIDLSQKNITNKSISESKTPLYFNMEEFSS